MASKQRIVSVGQKGVRGGTEIIAYSKSPRGTKFISNSIVVLKGEKTKEEYKKDIERAVNKILGASTE